MAYEIGDEIFVVGPVSEESADEWIMRHNADQGARRGYYEKKKYGSGWAIYLIVTQ